MVYWLSSSNLHSHLSLSLGILVIRQKKREKSTFPHYISGSRAFKWDIYRQQTKVTYTLIHTQHNRAEHTHTPYQMICIVCRQFLYCRTNHESIITWTYLAFDAHPSAQHDMLTLTHSGWALLGRNAEKLCQCRRPNASKSMIYGLKFHFVSIFMEISRHGYNTQQRQRYCRFQIMIIANLQWLVNWTCLSR